MMNGGGEQMSSVGARSIVGEEEREEVMGGAK
jgi:hypothetical protein